MAVCARYGCPELTQGRETLCRINGHLQDAERLRVARRGDRYAGDYRQRRAETIAAQPYCTDCGTTERLTADHVGNLLVTRCISCNVARANRARTHARTNAEGP